MRQSLRCFQSFKIALSRGLIFAVISLTSIPSISLANATGHWASEASASGNPLTPLCIALAERMTAMHGQCVWDALETYPNFSTPPWTILSPQEHLDLIAKLLAVAQGASPEYVERSLSAEQLASHRSQAQEFIKAGGEVHIWHARLLSHFSPDSERPAPPGKQAVIVMTVNTHFFPTGSHVQCPGKHFKGWLRHTFIVLPDLSGPDPRVGGPIASELVDSYPVIYRGKTLLIHDQLPFVFPYAGPVDVNAVQPRNGLCYLAVTP